MMGYVETFPDNDDLSYEEEIKVEECEENLLRKVLSIKEVIEKISQCMLESNLEELETEKTFLILQNNDFLSLASLADEVAEIVCSIITSGNFREFQIFLRSSVQTEGNN